MNINMKYRALLIYALLLVLITGPAINVFAQDEEEIEQVPCIMLFNYQNIDGHKSLEAKMMAKVNGEKVFPQGLKILFYSYNDMDTTDLLGEVTTNYDGIASYSLPDDLTKFKNDTGVCRWKAVFEGNEQFYEAIKTKSVFDVEIEISFDEIDSVKTVLANAYIVGKDGSKTPVNGKDLYFFSNSLFGHLPLGSGWLDEGACTFEFPTDLPGKSEGEVTVFGKFTDVGSYGLVGYSNTTKWGVPTNPDYSDFKGKIWTTDPPLWMIMVLAILLLGVWSHYLYVFISLRKIKKAA